MTKHNGWHQAALTGEPARTAAQLAARAAAARVARALRHTTHVTGQVRSVRRATARSFLTYYLYFTYTFYISTSATVTTLVFGCGAGDCGFDRRTWQTLICIGHTDASRGLGVYARVSYVFRPSEINLSGGRECEASLLYNFSGPVTNHERRQLVSGQVRGVSGRLRVAVAAAVAVRGAAVVLAARARVRGRARARRGAAHAHARARPARQRARAGRVRRPRRVLGALRYFCGRVQPGYHALASALKRKYTIIIIISTHT